MQQTGQRDTPPELALRRALHAMGLRYRVDRAPIRGFRRRADIVFSAARVAVFVDGCFWHGCPIHGTWPKSNGAWWREKIEANKSRDADTNARLAQVGWRVVRVWAHDDPQVAAEEIAATVRRRFMESSARPKAHRAARAGRVNQGSQP
jgi:DNA mismatch endonuclease, patch repair protein